MTKELTTLYTRDLNRLQADIEAFQNEENIWLKSGSIKNSSGNLCLHILGNLNTYIGKNLGKSGYVRDREAEFNSKGISKEELVNRIIKLKVIIEETIGRLTTEELDAQYPENVLGYEMTTRFFLIHLLAHLSYHLGQINYLRRTLE